MYLTRFRPHLGLGVCMHARPRALQAWKPSFIPPLPMGDMPDHSILSFSPSLWERAVAVSTTYYKASPALFASMASFEVALVLQVLSLAVEIFWCLSHGLTPHQAESFFLQAWGGP